MKAGRELDALVAEKVMGHVWKHGEIVGAGDIGGQGEGWGLPNYDWVNPKTQPYSTDIAAAWEVVEKLCNWDVDDNMLTLKGQAGDPKNVDDPGHWWKAEISGTSGKFMGEADTVPEAICLAALRAKGIDIDAE